MFKKSSPARIEFRPTLDQKQLFERAAAMQGRSLTEFLIASAEESANRTLRDYEVLELRGEAREKFLSALIHPAAPNAKLRALAKWYVKNVESR